MMKFDGTGVYWSQYMTVDTSVIRQNDRPMNGQVDGKLADCITPAYYLGPVVQSIVSLTSSLRVISLTVLADSIHNILIFFAEKIWVAFALTFFQQKISAYLRITRLKFLQIVN